MGGGGVMRTVAKVAGIGISSTGGLRGIPSLPTGENIVSAAARKTSRPVGAIVSSHDGVSGGEAVNHVQRPAWELEDWEFYGYDGELALKPASDPLPRLVFGGAPTIEEAKEATLDLKDALEKVYLKSPTASTKSEDSVTDNQEMNLPELLSNTNVCVTGHGNTVPYAVQAFKFLHENPAAQTVVSSIACDPNVWNAVMQNEELTKFLKSQHTTVSPPDTFTEKNNLSVDGDFNAREDLKENESFGAGFSRFIDNLKCKVVDMVGIDNLRCKVVDMVDVDNLKCKVVDMVGSLSEFIQKTFGDFMAEKKSKDGDDKFIDTTILGSSFVGLAVFVILLVVLKRG